MLKNYLNLRNVVAVVISLAVTTTFSSCEDDENGNGSGSGGNASTITATNVIGNTAEIANVKAYLWDSDDQAMVIAEAPFLNNGFTLELPTSVSNNFLWLLEEAFEGDGITVSDSNARGTEFWTIIAYNAAGNRIGGLSFADFDWRSENQPNVRNEAVWLYVDRNVSITGERRHSEEWGGTEYIYITNFNLNLRRGWNIVYARETRTAEGNVETRTNTYTSQRPAGVNLSWRFD